MEVRILGPLEVVHAGTPVALGGSKQRAVFAMLALRVNRVVSMDVLVDGLRGTAPPADPINVVQVYLSRPRKVLHPAGTRDTGRWPADPAETRVSAAAGPRAPGPAPLPTTDPGGQSAPPPTATLASLALHRLHCETRWPRPLLAHRVETIAPRSEVIEAPSSRRGFFGSSSC